MPNCLLFDLFGTLVRQTPDAVLSDLPQSYACYLRLAANSPTIRSRTAYAALWQEALQSLQQQHAMSLAEIAFADVAAIVIQQLGQPLAAVIADDPIHHEQVLHKQVLHKQVLDELVKATAADQLSSLEPVAGAAGMIKRLAPHYQLGLIANTTYPPLVYSVLQREDMDQYFQCVTLSANVGYRKPASVIFEQALEQLDVPASDCVYIGSSYLDYRSASELGLTCYLVGRHARVPRERQLRDITDLAIHFDTRPVK